MKKMKYILVLALLISGCEDMKMDRKVAKNSELQSQSGQLIHAQIPKFVYRYTQTRSIMTL
jgi:hypothetical protein